MKRRLFPLSVILLFIIVFASFTPLAASEWSSQILPSEQMIEIDETSGAKIIYVTTNKANDNNLYFHDRCWLFDNSAMLFLSNRTGRQEIFAYIAETGELARLDPKNDSAASLPVASRHGDRIYVVREHTIYQWHLSLSLMPHTTLRINEKMLCDFAADASPLTALNENCTGELLSFGYRQNDQSVIVVIDTKSGEITELTRLPFPVQHIQFSRTRPDLLSFARSYGSDTAPLAPNEPPHARIWLLNVNIKTPVPAFYQQPGELVTHECWWQEDQLTFIGGHRPEEGHVKVVDIRTGDIRVIGPGAWLPETEPRELARVNWWHACGSPDGRWIAADNWHGVIAIFDAKTTLQRILTRGHRIYGSGAHPHVGWDLTGKSVEFTSNKRGNADVCIGVLPKSW